MHNLKSWENLGKTNHIEEIATAESASTGASKRALTFQIAPRGGFGQILGNSTYQAKGKYAAGLKLGVGFGEYFGIQGGYTYG